MQTVLHNFVMFDFNQSIIQDFIYKIILNLKTFEKNLKEPTSIFIHNLSTSTFNFVIIISI